MRAQRGKLANRLGRTKRHADPEHLLDIATAKTSRPWSREGLIERTSLLHRLRTARVSVASVVAPAGFGKTTLVGQWADRDDRPFAWVSCDGDDNDPTLLVRYIAIAIGQLEMLESGALEAPRPRGVPVLPTMVGRLGSAISSVGHRFVLVLDDVHKIDSRDSRDLLEALVDYIPDGSAIALVSREATPIPAGRLRGQGRILEIDATDLAMDEREARSLLDRVGVHPPDDEMAELLDETEGWPVALYLAAVGMETGAIKGVSAFHGDDRVMSDFLRSEFLARLPRKQVTFMRRTAVLEHMSGPLCDAILQGTGSAKTLEALAESNLLVVPLGRTREWYRYHHLLREMLLGELEQIEPEQSAELNRLAADWSEKHHLPEAAIRHAQAAGQTERVADLMAANLVDFSNAGQAATVDRWLEWLEQNGSIEPYGQVAVMAAWHHGLNGRAAEAERMGRIAAASDYKGPLPDGSSSLQPWLRVLQAAFFSEGVDRMLEDAEAALMTLASGSQWRARALALMGIGLNLRGDTEAAEDAFADAAETGERHNGFEAALVAHAERARIAADRGDWDETAVLLERATSVQREHGLEHYATAALTHGVAARLAAHRGDAGKARDHLARAYRLRPLLSYALPYFAVRPLLDMARAHVALGDAAGARTLLREVEGVMRRRPDLGPLGGEADELRLQIDHIRVTTPGATTLTTAELRLLPYLPSHLSFRAIGERLFISPHTVKSQAISIYRKLGVTSRADAVTQGRDLGLLDP